MFDPASIRCGPVTRRLLEVLASQPGKWVTTTRIIDALYGDDPNGGPDNANLTIRVLVHTARPRLQAMGWDIESIRGSRRLKEIEK